MNSQYGRQTRFTTQLMLVTGNSIEELETAAIQQGAEVTGRPPGVLEIAGSYTVFDVPPEGVPNRYLLSDAVEAREAARGTGHRLYARIAVCEYRASLGLFQGMAWTWKAESDNREPKERPMLEGGS